MGPSLLAKLAVLTPQPAQLLKFSARQTVLSTTLVAIGLPHLDICFEFTVGRDEWRRSFPRVGAESPPMTVDDYASLDGLSLAALVRDGEVSARELAELAFEAAGRVNSVLNAIIELHVDRLHAPDSRPAVQPFAGVPLLLKDLGVTEQGRLQECGCELLRGHVAARDSELVRRFGAAGFNLIGRTTTPELGWSAFTESRLTGTTCNPWDPTRSAGGSSGGSAAAVAAGVVPVAHGSDGSGSIRNPAGWCGLVGLKTSRGRISTAPAAGMPPGGRSVSHVVSRSLRDSAAVLDAAAEMMRRTPSLANLQPTTWITYQHGKSLSASRLLAAIDHLDKLSREAGPFFDGYPVLLTPTSIDVAPPHGTHDAARADLTVRGWSDIIHAEDCFLLLANVTGQPAVSLPLHHSADGLPIGMQLIARLGDEATLFQLGGQLERSLPWSARRPRIHAAATGQCPAA